MKTLKQMKQKEGYKLILGELDEFNKLDEQDKLEYLG